MEKSTVADCFLSLRPSTQAVCVFQQDTSAVHNRLPPSFLYFPSTYHTPLCSHIIHSRLPASSLESCAFHTPLSSLSEVAGGSPT
eukprot:scaffold285811_cov18-Tisochrysis_lutea.AAC.1